MLTTVQCPVCQTATRVPEAAAVATCPKCLTTFSSTGEDAARQPEPAPIHQEQASTETWVNAYGAVALALATLALLCASFMPTRTATIALASFGLLVVAVGLVAGRAKREDRDWAWFTLGSALNGLVLFVVLVRPGMLNSFWGLDVPDDGPDPEKLIAVPRKQPRAPGKLLTADDSADAGKEAIRQGTVLARVESVKSGTRGGISCLLVHVTIANLGDDPFTISGLGANQNTPALTDSSGRSFAFLKRQKRTYSEGPPIFGEDPGEQTVEVRPGGRQDYLLLFEAPPRVESLKLEVPASAWGRPGRCKFVIAGVFADF